MYLTPTDKHWVLDIETDDLRDKVTTLWVMCVENCITGEKLSFTDNKTIKKWIEDQLNAGCYFIGHNIIGFDAPVLNRLVGCRLPASRLVDTFLLSMLYSPSLNGGHGLEAWGQRLKYAKLPFKDFSRYTPEMLTYCQRDVSLTVAVFKALTKRMRQVGFTEMGAEIEHLHWHIIQNYQKRHGFPFDYEGAEKLLIEIRNEEHRLRDEIHQLWPPELKVVGEYKQAYRKDGSHTKRFEEHRGQFPKLEIDEDGSYRAFGYVEFNLGSPPQRVAKLLELGWEPTSRTKAGNPKVDEESLLKYAEKSGTKEVLALARWIVFNSRGNMVNTWLKAYNEKTGAIHGNLWLAGTLRYRHDNPNSANVPAVRVKEWEEDGEKKKRILYGAEGAWTFESRNVWNCGNPRTHSLVGIDAKGIQLRILAHYLNDPEFSKAILSEDPHSANQKTMGLPTRALTKTITYATLMGAGDARVAAEADVSLKEAKAAKAKFFSAIPTFQSFLSRLKRELASKGRISLCDGTPILVNSDHMVIPYLLQGDESRIMKKAWIILYRKILTERLDAVKVGDIHDEGQWVVLNENVDRFIELALESFIEAGKFFNYNIPIEGDAKVGKTWAETH